MVQGNGARPPQASIEYVVSHSFKITGRGTGLTFEGDPPTVEPLGKARIEIRTPGGSCYETDAEIEAVLLSASPAREAVAMLLRDCEPADIPPGTVVRILDR